jgi:hypothetical protein
MEINMTNTFKVGDKVSRKPYLNDYCWLGSKTFDVVLVEGVWLTLLDTKGIKREGLYSNFEKATTTIRKQDHKFKIGDYVVGNSTHIMSKRNGMSGEVVGNFEMRGYYVKWSDMSCSLYALETELDHAPNVKNTKIIVKSSVVTTQVETRSLELTSDQVETIVRNWAKDYHGFVNPRVKSNSRFYPVSTVTMAISETLPTVIDKHT